MGPQIAAGRTGRLFHDRAELSGEAQATAIRKQRDGLSLALGKALGDFAGQLTYSALEFPNSGLSSVSADDALDRIIREDHLLYRQACLRELARDQITAGDMDFFLFAIPGQPD